MEGRAEVQLNGSSVSCVGQDLKAIPQELSKEYGATTKSLDLSHNLITSLDSLEGFKKLESLVVDSNQLSSKQPFLSRMDSLTTLCVNDNQIADIEEWLSTIATAFPNLSYLSMLKNPACPNYFTGKDQQDYARYRLYVLHRIPGLKFLDSSPVTAQERAEAKRVGHLMRVARPSEQSPVAGLAAPNRGGEQGEDGEGGEAASEHHEEEEGALPPQVPGRGKASFGVSRYVYHGKQSEGNRFILNEDL